MVVLDIGAHLGLYSLIAAREVGTPGSVYAFEPDPRTFPHLVRNIDTNGFKNRATPIPSAMSETCAERRFFADDKNPAASGLSASHASDALITAQCVAIDDFLACDVRVDVVKIDIEGEEVRALRGMAETIARASESVQLFVEVHPDPLRASGSSAAAAVAQIEELGFKAEFIDELKGLQRPLSAADFAGKPVHLRCSRRRTIRRVT